MLNVQFVGVANGLILIKVKIPQIVKLILLTRNINKKVLRQDKNFSLRIPYRNRKMKDM